MMYMSGSQLNIFSINTVSGAIMSPLTGLFSLHKTFSHLADSTTPSSDANLTTPKLVFVALNLVWLCVGLYKMSSMRLLPTTSADWMHRIAWKEMQELTSIPPDDGFYS
jgi:hypothetical protein